MIVITPVVQFKSVQVYDVSFGALDTTATINHSMESDRLFVSVIPTDPLGLGIVPALHIVDNNSFTLTATPGSGASTSFRVFITVVTQGGAV